MATNETSSPIRSSPGSGDGQWRGSDGVRLYVEFFAADFRRYTLGATSIATLIENGGSLEHARCIRITPASTRRRSSMTGRRTPSARPRWSAFGYEQPQPRSRNRPPPPAVGWYVMVPFPRQLRDRPGSDRLRLYLSDINIGEPPAPTVTQVGCSVLWLLHRGSRTR
jgi:hypothetical protein